jgi:hypothetical protein
MRSLLIGNRYFSPYGATQISAITPNDHVKSGDMICPVSSWALPENAKYGREPAGLLSARTADFDAKFDRLTVFYDCFRVSESRVMLIGPPLTSFPGILDSLQIRSTPSGQQSAHQVHNRFTTRFGSRRVDNLSEVLVEVEAGVTSLHLESAAGHQTMQVQPSGRDLFRGKKVLFTLSKDNDPQWICDWMRFHRDMQGANAVLLYDNASTAYSLSALEMQMSQISGFDVVCVIPWPYKYGPRAAGRQLWDYAYSQGGAMEDARWRFLSDAYGVLNCDIDELVLSQQGNVFDKVAATATGCLRFTGRWVTQPAASSDETPRHRESTDQLRPRWRLQGPRLKDTNLCPAKWVVVPSRCPAEAHWSVHEIVGRSSSVLKQADTYYRHFTRIGTNWKNNRHQIEGDASKTRRKDTDLEQAFAGVRWEQ